MTIMSSTTSSGSRPSLLRRLFSRGSSRSTEATEAEDAENSIEDALKGRVQAVVSEQIVLKQQAGESNELDDILLDDEPGDHPVSDAEPPVQDSPNNAQERPPFSLLLLNLLQWFSKLGLLLTFTPPNLWPAAWHSPFHEFFEHFATFGFNADFLDGFFDNTPPSERSALVLAGLVCVLVVLGVFGRRTHHLLRGERDRELWERENVGRWWCWEGDERHRANVREEEHPKKFYIDHLVGPVVKLRAKVRWLVVTTADTKENEVEKPDPTVSVSTTATLRDRVKQEQFQTGWISFGPDWLEPKPPLVPGQETEQQQIFVARRDLCARTDAALDAPQIRPGPASGAELIIVERQELIVSPVGRQIKRKDSGEWEWVSALNEKRYKAFEERRRASVVARPAGAWFLEEGLESRAETPLFERPVDVGVVVRSGIQTFTPGVGMTRLITVKNVRTGKELRCNAAELAFRDFRRKPGKERSGDGVEVLAECRALLSPDSLFSPDHYMLTSYYQNYQYFGRRWSLVWFLTRLPKNFVDPSLIWRVDTWLQDQGTFRNVLFWSLFPLLFVFTLLLVLHVIVLHKTQKSFLLPLFLLVASVTLLAAIIDILRILFLRSYWLTLHTLDTSHSEWTKTCGGMNNLRRRTTAGEKFWDTAPRVEVGLLLFLAQALHIPTLKAGLELVLLWRGGGGGVAGVRTAGDAPADAGEYLPHFCFGVAVAVFCPLGLVWSLRRLRAAESRSRHSSEFSVSIAMHQTVYRKSEPWRCVFPRVGGSFPIPAGRRAEEQRLRRNVQALSSKRDAKPDDWKARTEALKLFEECKRRNAGRKINFAQYKDITILESAAFAAVVMLLSSSKHSDAADTLPQQTLSLSSTFLALAIVFIFRVFRTIEANRAELVARATLLGSQALLLWQTLVFTPDSSWNDVSETPALRHLRTALAFGFSIGFSLYTFYKMRLRAQARGLYVWAVAMRRRMRAARVTEQGVAKPGFAKNLTDWSEVELSWLTSDQLGWLVSAHLDVLGRYWRRLEHCGGEGGFARSEAGGEGGEGSGSPCGEEDAVDEREDVDEYKQRFVRAPDTGPLSRSKAFVRKIDSLLRCALGLSSSDVSVAENEPPHNDPSEGHPLEVLRVTDCPTLTTLPPALENFSRLREISFSYSSGVKGPLPDLGKLRHLKTADFTYCTHVFDPFFPGDNVRCTTKRDDLRLCESPEQLLPAGTSSSNESVELTKKLSAPAGATVRVTKRVLLPSGAEEADSDAGGPATQLAAHVVFPAEGELAEETPGGRLGVQRGWVRCADLKLIKEERGLFRKEEDDEASEEEEEEEDMEEGDFPNVDCGLVQKRWPHIVNFRWSPEGERE